MDGVGRADAASEMRSTARSREDDLEAGAASRSATKAGPSATRLPVTLSYDRDGAASSCLPVGQLERATVHAPLAGRPIGSRACLGTAGGAEREDALLGEGTNMIWSQAGARACQRSAATAQALLKATAAEGRVHPRQSMAPCMSARAW